MPGLKPEQFFSEAYAMGFDGVKKVHPGIKNPVGVLLNFL